MAGRAHRIFCAIFPPTPAAEGLLSLLSERELPPHRATPLCQVHLTAMFVGDTRSDEVPSVEESVRRAVSGIGSFDLTPRKMISLPAHGPARLIAVETDAPPRLLEIHRRLVSRLARRPGERDPDGFRPHLTLCRFVGAGARGFSLDETVETPAFRVDRVDIVESVLHSTGAEYRTLLSVPLHGGTD